MKKLIESIEKHGSPYLIHWFSDLDEGIEKLPEHVDWLFLAEKFYAKAFGENHFDLDCAKTTILIHERMYKHGNKGALLSAANIRLRIIELVPLSEWETSFNPEVMKGLITQQLTLPASEAESMASHWQTLEVEQIKLLRSFKNWVMILLRLEKITNRQYDEFEEWKKILHLLP